MITCSQQPFYAFAWLSHTILGHLLICDFLVFMFGKPVKAKDLTNVKVARDSQSVMSKSEVWRFGNSLVILLLRFANVDFVFSQVTTTEVFCSLSISSHPKVTRKAWPESMCLKNVSHYKKKSSFPAQCKCFFRVELSNGLKLRDELLVLEWMMLTFQRNPNMDAFCGLK